MAQQCPIPNQQRPLIDCRDDCVTRFFEHEESYVAENGFFCVVTRKYRWDTCEVGLGIGRHAFSITLLPGEEVELEEVRKDRFSRALHDQRSVAAELELTVEETVRDEVSTKDEYFFEHVGENNFKLFGQKRKGQRTYRDAVTRLEETLRQTVTKSAARVSAKNEIAIDVKAEAENVYRSVRKVRNPNPCQPVTYNFYQLAKRLTRRLTLVEVVHKCSPPAGDEVPRPGLTTFRSPVARPSPARLDVVAPPPAHSLTAAPPPPMREGCAAPAPGETVVRGEFAAPAALERNRRAVIEDIRAEQGEEAARRADAALAEIDDLADPGGGGLIFEEEICIATTGFHVEGLVSPCAVCEDTELKKKELEVERCKLELEKLKCEIELCRMEADREPDYGGDAGKGRKKPAPKGRPKPGLG